MTPPSSRSYIPEIDSLRAIAVLSVILFHFNPLLLPGGFAGVDVFFVISGYVVSSSMAKHQQNSFLTFTLQFYARRILRIYPALIACLIAVALIQTLFVPASWLSNSSSNTALYAFFGLSNFALIWFNDGYFSPRVEFNPFTHTWSLAVEEQFYLLFPFVFYLWIKYKNKSVIARLILPLLLISSFIYSSYISKINPNHAYYLIPSRFWELACGALLFMGQQQWLIRRAWLAQLALICGLLLIAAGLIYSDPKAFPFPWAILACAGTVLSIMGITHQAPISGLQRGLQQSGLVYIGKISYSLYLWHWPVLALFRWTIGLEQPLYIVCAAALTFMLSVLSYHFIEKPVRQHTWLIRKPNWQIVGSGLAMIVLSTLCTQLIFKAQPQLSLSVTKDARTWYPEAWASPANFRTRETNFAKHKIFIMGDSHTGAYRTMLQMLSDQEGVTVIPYSAAGCAVANLRDTASPACMQFIQQAISDIESKAVAGDVVFLASLRMPRLSDQWVTFHPDQVNAANLAVDSPEQRAKVIREAEEIVGRFEQRGLIVILDGPKPTFKSPAFRCADWFNAHNPVCQGGLSMTRKEVEDFSQPVQRTIHALQNNHPKLVVWDTLPLLCNTQQCLAFDGSKPLFFDGDHLSAHGNRVLYPAFFSLLSAIWSGR